MSIPNVVRGGTQAIRSGSLIRRLDPIVIAQIGGSVTQNTSPRYRVRVKNLQPNLDLHISVVLEGAEGAEIMPESMPANPGRWQLYPVTRFPDTSHCFLRPVFQDPTLVGTDNKNHPLAQDIPFGWEGSTSTDELLIVVDLSVADYSISGLNGRILVQLSVAYDGAWQNVDAVNFAVSQVIMRPETGIVGQYASTIG